MCVFVLSFDILNSLLIFFWSSIHMFFGIGVNTKREKKKKKKNIERDAIRMWKRKTTKRIVCDSLSTRAQHEFMHERTTVHGARCMHHIMRRRAVISCLFHLRLKFDFELNQQKRHHHWPLITELAIKSNPNGKTTATTNVDICCGRKTQRDRKRLMQLNYAMWCT